MAKLTGPAKAVGAVFCKAPKVGQDRRADLPVIGPETVKGANDAGIAGIWIEAGGVMVLDADRVREAAERLGVTVWVGEA